MMTSMYTQPNFSLTCVTNATTSVPVDEPVRKGLSGMGSFALSTRFCFWNIEVTVELSVMCLADITVVCIPQ